jgi:hypothetical protein
MHHDKSPPPLIRQNKVRRLIVHVIAHYKRRRERHSLWRVGSQPFRRDAQFPAVEAAAPSIYQPEQALRSSGMMLKA